MKTFAIIVSAVAVLAVAGVGYREMQLTEQSSPALHTRHNQTETREFERGYVEEDEHGAKRILISDVKLAAAGAVLAEAGEATLRDTLSFNGVLRANQETVVQVTPRFPGIVRSIRKRIGDAVASNDLLASIESNQSLTVYDLKAPISGTVIDRQISLGEYASEQKPAFVVADLSTIWVDLSIYRQDLKRVRTGDEVLIDADDGGADIKGYISYVAPVGSIDTQTAIARIVLDNTDGRLRPGLFATARLVLTKRSVPVAVRAGAIQTLENRTVVFVREDKDKIEARPVEVGESDARFVEIRAGMAAGEAYVAENSFVVKAEMGKGKSDHEH
ncbi:Secretion protein HlyD [Nitrobacter sp. Nb-311A]|uniref:divalent metal ion exporter adaptor subunit IhpB n=1 Tax=unclassified Nitrobacter TaxID=2620411 RepID=UPI00006873A4|nr:MULTISPECIES: efflux RND transporter periplasmic adaptor subunit [unclassified Nitrobacter]EAQ35595.1 Secretion protein HlyD [Nitrobacter sp. Nb-311A]MCB1393028.1 efflux RND transporter periplasmic adaptor subunit [Nitrobacter sp.]MCV0385882.1 efflux RND transporter periplasmic adaptor subunit [Nitrobacter sp.]